MNFSEKLVYLRTINGKTRKVVADALGLAYPTIAKYETTNIIPAPEILQNIANLFDVPIHYLIGDSIADYNDSNSLKELKNSEKEKYNVYNMWKNIFALCLINKTTISELSMLADVDNSILFSIYNGLAKPDYNTLEALFNTLIEKKLNKISEIIISPDNLYDIDFIFTIKGISIILRSETGNELVRKEIPETSVEYAVYIAKVFLPEAEKNKIYETIVALCTHYNKLKKSKNQFNNITAESIHMNSSELNGYLHLVNEDITVLETKIKSLNNFFQSCVSRYLKNDFEEKDSINTFLSILDIYFNKYKNSYDSIRRITNDESKFSSHMNAITIKYAQIQTAVIKLCNLYEACFLKYLRDELSEFEKDVFSKMFSSFSIFI
jgi:transcriptional regulator with XRE-family HTH domain